MRLLYLQNRSFLTICKKRENNLFEDLPKTRKISWKVLYLEWLLWKYALSWGNARSYELFVQGHGERFRGTRRESCIDIATLPIACFAEPKDINENSLLVGPDIFLMN